MRAKSRQFGITLTEMVIVVAGIAVLAVVGVPAVRALLHSFESRSGTKAMIQATMGSARAIAAREQHYAGIRFQKAYDPDGPLGASQYMVFIVQDPDISAWGFRAVDGLKPMKLPDSVGVMDFTIVPDRKPGNPISPYDQFRIDDPALTDAAKDAAINEVSVTDMGTFSIIFSPAGKLVVHGVQVKTRGVADEVFNIQSVVEAGNAMFYEDSLAVWGLGLGPEPSRNNFVIYDTKYFKTAYGKGLAWSDYLVRLVPEINYINAYTGTMISRD